MRFTNNETEETKPCLDCQAGQMHRRFVTYYTWLSEELITVPNFPAWICDVCGRRKYDSQAISQLNLLLNPNAGRPSKMTSQQIPRIPPKRTSALPDG